MSAPAGPSVWRLLTLADIGAPVGAAGWSITDSGDPALPMRVTAPANTEKCVVFPLSTLGLIPTATWRIYARMGAKVGGNTQSTIGVGTWAPGTAASGGTIGTAVGAGVVVSVGTSGDRAYRTGGVGASGAVTTAFAPDVQSDDAIVRVDVQTYGYTTGGAAQRRVASAHLVLEDGSGEAAASNDATGSYHQTVSSGAAVGTADGPCIVCGHSAAEPTAERTVDVAIYVLATPAPDRT